MEKNGGKPHDQWMIRRSPRGNRKTQLEKGGKIQIRP